MSNRDDVTADHERFVEWDAAYLLGALSPADRHAYERHLAECPECGASVGDLAGVPSLLAALPRSHGLALAADDADAVPDLMPTLLHRVHVRRRTRRWWTAGALVAAAAIVAVLALTLPAMVAQPGGTSVATSLQPVAGASTSNTALTAEVTLTAEKWGTSVGMVCRWTTGSEWAPSATPGSTNGGAASSRGDYGLWVVTTAGTAERVASWTAGPGDVVRTTDSTDVPLTHVARIELRSLGDGTVLLSAAVRHD